MLIQWILSPHRPSAVRVFAFTILAAIACGRLQISMSVEMSGTDLQRTSRLGCGQKLCRA